MPYLRGELGMNFQQRLGILVHQPADAAGLRAAEILRDDAAGREDHRIFSVGHLAGIAVAARRGNAPCRRAS